MKAADFFYEKPSGLADALNLLANDDRDVQLLAGGQSLIPMMNFRLAQPELLIDLNGIDELSFIEEDGDALNIGSMTRYADLANSSLVQKHVPLFTMALPHIAHAAVRNRGTIGGSVALADPAAEMPALLIALNAIITVASSEAERKIPANEFFLGIYETALAETELVKSITIPKATSSSRFGFYELARRHGDYAMAGVAIAVEATDPIKNMRMVLFSVSDRATEISEAANKINGQNLAEVDFAEVARDGRDEIEFQGDLNADEPVKRHLAGVVIERALKGMVQ